MSTKINGQPIVEGLGSSAGEGLPWGDIIAVGRACDLWLRKHESIRRKFNGPRMTREQQESDRAGRPRDVSGGTPELRRNAKEAAQ